MKKTSRKPTRKAPRSRRAELDWSKAKPNPLAKKLANCRWWVTLDPDLVDLLSGTGHVGDRLLGFAALQRKSKRERLVVSVPLTDEQYRGIREILARIGAEVHYYPPHPPSKSEELSPRGLRRRAG